VPRLRAVLFDFGDTLCGRTDPVGILLTLAAERGVTVDRNEAAALLADVYLRARTPEELGKGRDLSAELHRSCWTELYGAADAYGAGIALALYDAEIASTGWLPFPDTVEVLTALAERGVRMGVVSDTGFDLVPVLADHGLDRFFDVVVMSYRHGAVKPAAVLFDTACAALGVTRGETLMVGDNPHTDGGAVAHGIRTLLLPPGTTAERHGLDAVLAVVDADAQPAVAAP
jgi:putative hydrolase of the HAD superfamily